MRTSIPFLVLLAACGNDPNVTKITNAPVATILSPDNGQAVLIGDVLELSAIVRDEQDDPADLATTWIVDGALLCDGDAPAADTDSGPNVSCFATFDRAGAIDVVLRVDDTDGQRAVDAIQVFVGNGEVPTVEILSPDAGDRLYSNQLVELVGTVGDAEDEADTLITGWTSSLDGDLGTPTPTDSGRVVSAVTLSEGQHQVSLAVVDSAGNRETDSRILTVGPPNTAPDCAILEPIDRSGVVLGSTVDLIGTASDPDVDADVLQVSWESSLDGVLGTPTPTSDGDFTLPVDGLSAGSHAITLSVTDDAGRSCTDQIVLEVGSGPSIVVDSPLANSRVDLGSAITLDATATDADDAASDLIITWTSSVDGELSSGPPDSQGRSLDTRVDLSRGQHVLDVVVEDSIGLTAREQVGFVVNGPPTEPGVALTPDPAGSLDTLGAVIAPESVDAEGDAITYIYAWWRDGVRTPNTTSSIPADQTRAGETWTVEVRATDGSLSSDPVTATITVGDALPTVNNVRIQPTVPRDADDLTCAHDPVVDPDGDSATAVYLWTVNGADIAATGSILPSTETDRGDVITCTVTPTSATSTGLPRMSSPVEIANEAPTLATAMVMPSAPTVQSTLVCQTSGAFDADGDVVELSYTWEINGAEQPGGRELASGFMREDLVRCAATPSDGALTGATVWSGAVSVLNAIPVAEVPRLSPPDATANTLLICVPGGGTDADGDIVDLSLAWRVNGVLNPTTGPTLDPGVARRGDQVTCEVTPDDGIDVGATVSSDVLTVGNAAPTASDVRIDPALATTGTELTAVPSGFADADGDAEDWRYDWLVGGVSVGTESTLAAGTLARGETVVVVATPFDGIDTGAPVTSAPLTITNAVPTAPGVLLLPDDPAEGDSLVCAVTEATDADGDTVAYTIEWTVDDQPWTGSTTTTTEPGDTVPAGIVARGETWRCTVIPNDGLADGPSASDAAIVGCEAAEELCDLLDSDCDGDLVDNFPDVDLDGLPDCVDDDDDGDGVADADDCGPGDATIFPGATEIYNDGIDQDCNGTDIVTCWVDADGDGRGAPCDALDGSLPSMHTGDTGWIDCIIIGHDGDCDDDGEAWDGFDCDDNDASINPDAPEVCNDLDDNCDGRVDEELRIDLWTDADGDGWGSGVAFAGCEAGPGTADRTGDCDDGSAARSPDQVEVCNDQDDDCDGLTDEDLRSLFYEDDDGDGFGTAVSVDACSRPAGYADTLGDCDDSRADRSPGLPELCNGFDDDCDSAIDEDLLTTYYVDGDGDGYGTGATTLACSLPAGHAVQSGDCDDSAANRAPNLTETCNGIDDDCDSAVDEGLLITVYTDADNDGFGVGSPFQACSAEDGFATTVGDCADDDVAVNPGAVETCNGADDNCNGQTDEGVLLTAYTDADGDGYGTGAAQQVCSIGAGLADQGGDCNDGVGSTNPAAAETCNGADDNCNGQTDEGVLLTAYTDADGDGYGAGAAQQVCSIGAGLADQAGDCNDGVGSTNPAAAETCNGADDNCNGQTDEGVLLTAYADADGDGFGTGPAQQVCSIGAGLADQAGDCNDGVGSTNPAATETCNGADDNCNGQTDEGVLLTAYADADGDGFGTGPAQLVCTIGPGLADQPGDCNDGAGSANPAAAETCNGADDNCNGQADEGLSTFTVYTDGDGDGWGAGAASSVCAIGSGQVTQAGDCADNNAARNPGASETCNSVDDNCNGQTDEGVTTTYYVDSDRDTWGTSATLQACSQPSGYATRPGDCDDSTGARSPSNTEICNSIDDDCDSSVDEGLLITAWTDADGDSWGTGSAQQVCAITAGLADRSGDCADNAASRNPGASETCNSLDDNCNGQTDEGVTTTYYVDSDNDTWGTNATIQACAQPSGYTTRPGDCDDSTGARNPGNTEICNSIDDDCDSSVDEGLLISAWTDADGDSWGTGSAQQVCAITAGLADRAGDCADNAAARNPGASETCNSLDDNCNGQTDEGVTTTYYLDGDGDDYGGSTSIQACSRPGGYADVPGDCNDGNGAINPAAAEICNGIDDDCNSATDESGGQTWYQDADGDGYGRNASAVTTCSQPSGYVSAPGDCNDGLPEINPGATEVCNGLDDDCNGLVDGVPWWDPQFCEQF